jgi:Cu(I)/Ag(I) efflux system protein CusF
MKRGIVLAATVALAASSYAANSSNSLAPIDRFVIAAADTAVSEGEIRKIDPATRKLTIKHGELKNLDMPPMTMVFQVKDPAMIEQVKPGDKIKFRAEKVNGAFTVIEIEVVK